MDAKDTTITRITLLGEQHAVVLPDYAAREDLFLAHVEAGKKRRGNSLFRVLSAAIGLCTRIGGEKRANVSYAACGYDAMEYGGKVYSWLREQGASHEDIAREGRVVMDLVAINLFPREHEVAEARGN